MVEKLNAIIIKPKIEEKEKEKNNLLLEKEQLEKDRNNFFREKIRNLEKEQENIEKAINKKKSSIFKGFHKKDILKLEEKLKEIQTNIKSFEDAWYDFSNNEYDINRQLHDLDVKIYNLDKEITELNNIKTLKKMGLSFEDAIKVLTSNGIDFSLDENDINVYANETNADKDFKDLSDFVLVHKTMFAPKGDVVKTAHEAGVVVDSDLKAINVNGKDIRVPVKVFRNTLHFCVNTEVTGGFIGANDWDNYRYAVIVPFTSVKQEKIANFFTVDTYTNGGVELDKSCYILCPEEDYEMIKKDNPNTNVIKYKGQKVTGYANTFITLLGYKREQAGAYNWENEIDDEKAKGIALRNNLPLGVNHASAKEGREEKLKEHSSYIISTINSVCSSFPASSIEEVTKVSEAIYNNVKIYLNKILDTTHHYDYQTEQDEKLSQALSADKNMRIKYNMKELSTFFDNNQFNYNSKIFNEIEHMDTLNIEQINSKIQGILPSELYNVLNNFSGDLVDYITMLIILTSVYENYKINISEEILENENTNKSIK